MGILWQWLIGPVHTQSDWYEEFVQLCEQPLHGIQLSLESTISDAAVTSNSKTTEPTQTFSPFSLPIVFEDTPVVPNSTPVWTLSDQGDRYHTHVNMYKILETFLLDIDCEGQGQFLINDSGIQVSWRSGTGPGHYLQTLGLSLFLETHNVPCVHANTLVKNNQASLFMAPSRTGKSTLTASMVSKGYQLTTDDMAAVHKSGEQGNYTYSVFPSWNKVRLWPDASTHLAQQTKNVVLDNIKKVHQRFSKKEASIEQTIDQSPSQIKHLFYLDRKEGQEGQAPMCEITPIMSGFGLILLLQNSMLGDAYRGLKLEAKRMGELAQLLKQVPFYKVSYTSGLDHLDLVTQEIDKFIAQN